MDPALPPKRRLSGRQLLGLLGLLILLGGLLHFQQKWIQQAEVARKAEFNARMVPPPRPSAVLETADERDGTKLSLNVSPEIAGATAFQAAQAADDDVQAHFRDVAGQTDHAPLSIPVKLQGPRHRDRVLEYYAFRRREVEAYQRLSTDIAPAREAGIVFLEAYIRNATEILEAPSRDEVRRLAQAALAAGSKDPLVRTYAAYLELQEARHEVAPFEAVLRETIPALVAQKYPAITVTFPRIWAFADTHLIPHEQNRRWEPALVAIIRWLEEDSGDPRLRTCIYWRLSRIWNSLPEFRHPQIMTAMLQSGRIDPWLIHAFLGRHYVDLGWAQRGNGISSTVTEVGWAGLKKYLALASTHLQYAWHIAPEMPQPAERMIAVAMADDDPESRPYDWFLRAIEAEFDYVDAYWSLNNTLRPRWGGSHEDMFTFCRRCIETDQFDTAIPYLAINLLHDFERQEIPADGPLNLELEDFPTQPIVEQLATAFAVYRRNYPGALMWGGSVRDRTSIAVFFERFDLHDAALAEVRTLNGQFDASQFCVGRRLGLYSWARLAAAENVELRQRVLNFDRKLRTPLESSTPANVVDDLATECSLLKKLAPPNDRLSSLFFAHADKIIEQLRTFQATGTVTLDFDGQGTGWDISADRWEVDNKSAAIKLFRQDGQSTVLRISPLAQFALPILVETELTMADSKQYPLPSGMEWPILTLRRRHYPVEPDPYWAFDAGTHPSNQQQAFAASFYLGPGRTNTEKLADSNPTQRVELRVWPKGYEGRIGSFTQIVPDVAFDPQGFLSLGEINPLTLPRSGLGDHRLAGTLRVGKVRIKRIRSEAPPTSMASLEERATYWASRKADDGPDSRAALELGNVRFEQHRWDDVERIIAGLEQSAQPLLGTNSLKGRLRVAQWRYPEARQALELAEKEPGDDLVIFTSLAELLAAAPDAAVRDGRLARRFAEIVVRHTQNPQPAGHAALAAAFAELGDFAQAKIENHKAIELATNELKPLYEMRQSQYESSKPLRLPKRER